MVKTKISATAPKHILTIMDDDIEAAEAQKTEIWNKVKKDIVLKGFRKGKVPREHAEKVIGYDNIFEDYVRGVVTKGMGESGASIVGVGQVVIDALAEDKPTVLRVEVWLEPAVHLFGDEEKKLYEALEISVDDVDVEDGEVDAIFQRMREASATATSVEREAQESDAVMINFKGTLEDGSEFQGGTAKDYQVIIGGGILLPEFEAQLSGVKPGETKDISLTFPSTYPNAELANKKATFATEILDVQERILPEFDDEFAKQMGYDNVADGRTKVTADLATNKEQQQKAQAEQQLINGLIVAVSTDPIPGIMIKNQAESSIQTMLEGVGMNLEGYLKKTKSTQEQLLNQYQQQASTDVRARLILKAIAEEEELEATSDEKEEALKLVQPQFEGLDLDQLRAQLDMDSLTLNLRVQKAMDLVRSKAVPKKAAPEKVAPEKVAPEVTVEPAATEEVKEATTNG